MAHFYPQWPHIRRISVANPPSVTGYQVQVTVLWMPGMKDDFSDIRFSDYARTLPYWIETYTSRSSATVWVKLTETGEAAREFYLYYGNGGATSESDADDVFIFHDHFTDLTKWTETNVSGDTSVSNSIATLAITGTNVAYYTKITSNTSWEISNTILEAYIKISSTSVGRMIVGYTGITEANYDIGNDWYGLGSSNTSGSFPSTKFYKVWKIIFGPSNSKLYYDGTLQITGGSYSGTGSLFVNHHHTGSEYIDWIRVRAYAATEPTCTIVESGVNPAIPIYPILKLLTTGEATETLTINGSYSVPSSSTKTLDGTYHIIGQQTHNIAGSYSVLVASTPQIAGSYKVSTTHTLGPERVTNGDFETGDITGWAIEGEVYYYNVSDWDDIEEQDWGGYILGIQRDESNEGYGGISQTIDLTNVSKLTFDFESYNSASHNLYIYIKIGDSELIPVLYEGDDNGSTYEEWLTHAEVDVSSYTGEQKVSFLVEDCPPGTYNSLYLNNISAIPSGITGTYSVTASGSNLISGDYKVSTLSAKTLGGTYFLGSSGQADIDGTYHVLTTGDTGINGEYHVSCSTTKQVSGSYSVVLSPAATEVSGDYAVSITITKQASGSYSIISSSTKQVAGSYSVLTTGTKQIAGTYDIGGAGVTLIPGTYTVVTTSTKTISGDYLVTTLHTTTIDGDYSVYSASTYTKTVDGQYSVITPVTKTVSGDYSVSLSSTKLILGQYKASTLYTKTIDGTYTVTPSYTTTISGTYSIISSTTTTLDGTYTIPSTYVTVTIDGTYSVRYRVYRSRITKTRVGYGVVSHKFDSHYNYFVG